MELSSEEEALFVAISFGKIHRIEKLLQQVDDLNVRSLKDQTPLVYVCHVLSGAICSHVTRMLLKQKSCDPNARDGKGKTALMYASMDKDKCDAVRILVRNRACDTNLMDENGYTALMHAVANDNMDAVDILLFCPRVVCKVDVNMHSLSGATATDLAVESRNARCCQTLVKRAGADVTLVHDVALLNTLLAKT
ncbi:ankyrin repeat domain-containing protein 34B-like [Aplysia californica]|uniref:Ankyrin repeat domain-containing protein 34B-like n=1 Tax=Aplysia californica TaxID=6500 RepID=A0ABM1AAZ9_APLCA|nr:ankyrin repeat domain-containing protein 34B-like [Aplysia californica]